MQEYFHREHDFSSKTYVNQAVLRPTGEAHSTPPDSLAGTPGAIREGRERERGKGKRRGRREPCLHNDVQLCQLERVAQCVEIRV